MHVLYVDLLYIYNICLFVDSTYLFWPTKTLVIWYIDSELLELMPKGNVRWNCLWERFFQSTWGCYKPKYIVFFSIYIIIHLHLNNIQTTNCTSIYQWHIEFVNRLQLNYLSCTRFVMNRLSLFLHLISDIFAVSCPFVPLFLLHKCNKHMPFVIKKNYFLFTNLGNLFSQHCFIVSLWQLQLPRFICPGEKNAFLDFCLIQKKPWLLFSCLPNPTGP